MNIVKVKFFSVLGLFLFSLSIGTSVLASGSIVNLNMSAMIDNQKEAQPASGLNEADAVFEFPVEGGITRLMTIYKSDSNVNPSTEIGPIRSARPYFTQIGGAFNSVYAHAGGSQSALNGISEDKYDLNDMDYLKNAANFFVRKTDSGQVAPHNLYTSIGQIKSFYSQSDIISNPAVWPWKISSSASGDNMFSQSVVDVDYDGNDYDVRWIFNLSDNKYYRQIKSGENYVDYLDVNGNKVGTENLAIQYAETNSLKEIVELDGRALMCRQGKCQIGTWKQAGHDSVVKFYDMQGNEFTFISGKVWVNVTGNRYFHDITLSPGWNVVSTPRIVSSHQFSATENLNNFDIFMLDSNNVSGWSTMADLGQAEFTPLYGYFINNKTGVKQILTLNYQKDLNLNSALFKRNLKADWNVIGVANPAYALKQNVIANKDTDNISNILNSAASGISDVLDFNFGSKNRNDVKISGTWDNKVFSQVETMNDFLETKAYGVFLSSPALYGGEQNTDPIHMCKPLTVNVLNSGAKTVLPGQVIELANVDIKTGEQSVYVTQVVFNLYMDKAISTDNLEGIYLINTDTHDTYYSSNSSQGSKLVRELSFSGVNVLANSINNFKILGKVPASASNGQKYHLTLGSSSKLFSYFQPFWSAVTMSDVSYNSTEGDEYTVESNNSTVETGKYTMAFDSNMMGLDNKNVLAGSEVLVGAIKLTAQNENVQVKDFTLLNNLGTATRNEIAYLNLYSDREMTIKIGSASLDENKKAVFEGVNINVSTMALKYVYVSAVLKGINYSTANIFDATAIAERTIKLDIASSSDYQVKTMGVVTGQEMSDTGVASSTPTNTSTIMGAVISNITSGYPNNFLSNGIGKDIFSFQVTAPISSNLDYDMSPLGIKLSTAIFTVASSTGIFLDTFLVERVGGQNGEVAAKNDSNNIVTMGSGVFTINFANTYGSNQDLIVKPGETAEYRIKARVGGVGSGGSLQATLESLSSNVNYTHNTAMIRGIKGFDTQTVYTRLPGVSYVRGGSLTN